MDLSQDILNELIKYKVYMEKNDLASALRTIRDLISVAQDQEHYVEEYLWEEREAHELEEGYHIDEEGNYVELPSMERIPNEP